MKIYVLAYKLCSSLSDDVVNSIRNIPDVTVLRMGRAAVMVVEGPDSLFERVNLPEGWVASELKSYRLC